MEEDVKMCLFFPFLQLEGKSEAGLYYNEFILHLCTECTQQFSKH